MGFITIRRTINLGVNMFGSLFPEASNGRNRKSKSLRYLFSTPHRTRMPVASQIPYLLTSKYLLRFGVLGIFFWGPSHTEPQVSVAMDV